MLDLQEESGEGGETGESTTSNVGNSGTGVGSWLAVGSRRDRASASWVSLCWGHCWVCWCSWDSGVLADWWVVWSWARWHDWAGRHRGSRDPGGGVDRDLGRVLGIC